MWIFCKGFWEVFDNIYLFFVFIFLVVRGWIKYINMENLEEGSHPEWRWWGYVQMII
ncbi:hypothetical protein HMPREF9225_0095 [Peptoniphilus duerdenii ATCC BAA-1640]|uniref:Uncharacterized protein n=1 Tax=Peptoniphilus duerdenii ATCC BAA-1640 TaxID=862517 RepID=E0NIV6_9FIRM|nr:hypothetical protein HMPREF9225_0095 [Peptoniphilus duerdenii ATCC BAA-1640]